MKTANPETPTKRLDTTTWAVRLGANTSKRLAYEWKVVESVASKYLTDAFRAGRLLRERKQEGSSVWFEYRVAP